MKHYQSPGYCLHRRDDVAWSIDELLPDRKERSAVIRAQWDGCHSLSVADVEASMHLSRPRYDVQAAVDTKHHLFVEHEGTRSETIKGA